MRKSFREESAILCFLVLLLFLLLTELVAVDHLVHLVSRGLLLGRFLTILGNPLLLGLSIREFLLGVSSEAVNVIVAREVLDGPLNVLWVVWQALVMAIWRAFDAATFIGVVTTLRVRISQGWKATMRWRHVLTTHWWVAVSTLLR